ncbi:hypothetical protein [Streptomyces sp. NPDC017991]|uniref:hypothetical protein n=1 Tax=Streptomyces sp. NPDC017991 TaxID=3365026 RepID=UPI003797C78C
MAVVVAAIAAAGIGVLAVLPASSTATLPVTDYQAEGDATYLIDASATVLTRVGVDGVNTDS